MKIRILYIIFIFFLYNSYCIEKNIFDNKIIISKNLELTKLNNNVYIHTSYVNLPEYDKVPANGLIVFDNNYAVMIDTPWNDLITEELINWIETNLNTEIRYLIITHYHDDNMGGIRQAHKEGIISYSLKMTSDILKEKGENIPNRIFNNSIELKAGNINIVAEFPGPGHTADNIIIWLPDFKILYGGCLVKSLSAKTLGNLADADIKNWPFTLMKVYNNYNDAQIVIPGHGFYGNITLILHTLNLCEEYINN